MIRTYKIFISPLIGSNCRFYPTCSDYCQNAIITYGILKGLGMSFIRIIKCNPWHEGGYDQIKIQKSRKLKDD